ncbi:MAG: ABC transporter substrate-binding protein [Xanthomonadaceae bacterium]|nr:ABC transporter substrate-binding protein [Xanthomonadaceae bacterium]
MMTRTRVKSPFVVFMVVLSTIFFIGISFSPAAESKAALSPQQQLKSGIDSLIGVLSDVSFKSETGKKQLEEKLVQMFKQHFDLTYTSKMCLGRHWRKITAAEKDEFVGLFSDLLKSTYIGRVDQYSGETVRYVKEIIQGQKALVKTVVISKGKEIPVNYKMTKRNGPWQVYDVIIEGVSMVRNYRSQFSSILQKKKFADLLNQIRDKIAKNQAEKDAAKEPQKG